MLGFAVQTMLEKYLHNAKMAYFAPKHGKGPWDALIGVLNNLFTSYAKKEPIRDLQTVVDIYQAWADRERVVHPSGPRYIIKDSSVGCFLLYNFIGISRVMNSIIT